jgi:hypothetical protein
MREIILRFQFTFHASTKILSYWVVETLGDLQSTSIGLDPGAKM